MPTRPPRPCPGCKVALIAHPATRCPTCATHHEQQRGGSTARGYDHRWQRIRRVVLARDSWCVLCLAKGLRVRASEADHIIPKRHGGGDNLHNLRGLCKACNAGRR